MNVDDIILNINNLRGGEGKMGLCSKQHRRNRDRGFFQQWNLISSEWGARLGID